MEDLPPTVLTHTQSRQHLTVVPHNLNTTAPSPLKPDNSRMEVFWFILGELYAASEERTYIGRDRLLTKAKERFLPTSQQEIRSVLTEMAEKNLVRISRGRGGSKLTQEGRMYWENNQMTF